MPNANLDEAKRWMDQAEADLKTAKDCVDDKNYYAGAFFSQQAAEKALKALLYLKGYRALITHSVTDLLNEAAKHHETFKRMADLGRELDRHYIGSRYPNFYPSGPAYKYYDREVAERCVCYAESILKEVKNYLRA